MIETSTSGDSATEPYIERGDGRTWFVVYPTDPGEGMDTCTGPHLTLLGARLSRWLALRAGR